MIIRTMLPSDQDRAAEIWLNANLQAHDFIDPRYWQSHLAELKAQLPQAEVYVCQGQAGLEGFIGLKGHFIAGIFVWPSSQGQGVGKALLDRAKQAHDRLRLWVYQKNKRAVAFYRREGFAIWRESADADTGEAEYQMEWTRKAEREEP